MTSRKVYFEAVVTTLLLLVLGLFFFGTILSEKRDISLQEKRHLATFPDFSLITSSPGDWAKALDEYLRDHFFLREDLVFLNGWLRVKAFRKSPVFFVLPGKDGWFYYNGDWALHDYLGLSGKTGSDVTSFWERLIAKRQQKLQAYGAQYLVAVAPNKEWVYPEFLPDRLQGKAGTTMLQALDLQLRTGPLSDHFLNLEGPLRQAKKTGRVYHKTDSHWNSRGAYSAYRAIVEKIRRWYPDVVPLSEERFDKRRGENSTGGDLILMMGLRGGIPEKDGEVWVLPDRCSEPEDSVINPETLPAGKSLSANGCPTGAALRVLVISDSFGEGVKDYFSETFKEVVYSSKLDLSHLKDFIAAYQPDVVIDLRVGRNLPRILSPGRDEET